FSGRGLRHDLEVVRRVRGERERNLITLILRRRLARTEVLAGGIQRRRGAGAEVDVVVVRPWAAVPGEPHGAGDAGRAVRRRPLVLGDVGWERRERLRLDRAD